MIQIEHHRFVFDLMNPHGYLLPLGAFGHKYCANLQTFGWNFFFRKLLKSLRVHRTVPFLRLYFDPPFFADFHSLKPFLQTRDDLVASLGILERVFTLVGFDGLSILAGKRVLEADDGAILHDTVVFAFFSRESAGGYNTY